jgi:hypothetical protein
MASTRLTHLFIARAGEVQELRALIDRAIQSRIKKLSDFAPLVGVHFGDLLQGQFGLLARLGPRAIRAQSSESKPASPARFLR